MNIHLIDTDGNERHVQGAFSDIGKLIDAKMIDTVGLRDGRVMCVDDAGWEYTVKQLAPNHFAHVPTKARKPVNAKATALYHAVCMPGTTHQIVGDVAIVVDAEVDA